MSAEIIRMSAEMNVPQIRFKDFAGEWSDTTLSDVIDVRSGKDYKHLGKGNIPVYGTGGYMLSVDSALSNDEDAIGIGRKGTIDKPYLLRAPFWTVDTLFYAVPKPKFKLDYLYCLFQKIDWKKHDESTGVPSLSKVAINNIPVRVTSEEEQTVIGNTFQKLDNLINQHQQKHDKLSNIKKGMLEKMFPKQGKTIPEIRFKGFSGEWLERSLKEIASDITDGNWIEAEHIFDSGEYRIIQTGNIGVGQYLDRPRHAKYFHQSNFDAVRGNEIFPGDILISRLADPAGRAAILPTTGYRMVTAVDVAIVRPEPCFDSYFLMTLLNRDEALKAVREWVSGTSHKRISHANLVKVKAVVPCVEEQAAIGGYFQRLDALINQHQQQINKLNNIKQACLSKMFV